MLYRPRNGVVVAAQWTGTNETEVRELLEDRPFPPIGSFVVRRNGGVDVVSSPDFAATYEPLFRT